MSSALRTTDTMPPIRWTLNTSPKLGHLATVTKGAGDCFEAVYVHRAVARLIRRLRLSVYIGRH
jgi:hypothetical protein